MSKRGDSPVILISVLGVTFALSVAGILWAQQFALNSTGGNNSENLTANSSKSINQDNTVYTSNPLQIKEITKETNSTSTAKPLKVAADLVYWPVKGEVTFMTESESLTTEGLGIINRLSEQILEYDPKSVGVKVVTNLGASQSSQTLGQKRGEQVAGSLRDRGLKHRIAIINNKLNPGKQNSPSTPESSNPSVEVTLFNLSN
jgi:outer membrane protein OmpA-like peptidoglycan-associated protein